MCVFGAFHSMQSLSAQREDDPLQTPVKYGHQTNVVMCRCTWQQVQSVGEKHITVLLGLTMHPHSRSPISSNKNR